MVDRAAHLSCAKCGACTVVCPVFRVDPRESLTARGKMHLLSLPFAGEPSRHFQNIFSQCLLCGACEQACSRNLPITTMIAGARARFPQFYGPHSLQKTVVRKVLARPGLLAKLVRAGISLRRICALPARSGLRLKLGLLEVPVTELPEGENFQEKKPGKALSYFPGCLARYLQPSVARATGCLAGSAGYGLHVPAGAGCCGLAAWAAGKEDEARELAWNNILAFAGDSGPILTSCASCSSHLARYPELFAGDSERLAKAREFADRVVEFATFFLGQPELRLKSGQARKVFYHDPCHLRHSAAGRENPRRLIDRIANVERVEPPPGPKCCGQGGLFHLGYPEMSATIFRQCAEAGLEGDPDLVVTTCSGCLMQWQQGRVEHDLPVTVSHLAVLLADCLAGFAPAREEKNLFQPLRPAKKS